MTDPLNGMHRGRPYRITYVDYWEKDALLVYDGKRHYFQFDGQDCTLHSALGFLKREGVEL